jgi:hypothetical protein
MSPNEQARRGLGFPHTPTFTDDQLAVDPERGVFIFKSPLADPPAWPAQQPVVQWQPAGAGRALHRLAVALGVERPR